MHNRWMLYIGIAIVVWGLVTLLAAIFQVDLGPFCLPTMLILIGLFMLLGPRMARRDARFHQGIIGDVRRYGSWTVADEEIWQVIGDVVLDLSQAEIPVGEATIRIYGFVGSVRVTLPEGVGLAAISSAVVTDARIFGEKRDAAMSTLEFTSAGYEQAERRLRLEMNYFVANLRVRQAGPTS